MTKDKIVVIGCGGHAKVVIELLRAMGATPAICIGDSDGPDDCLGVPALKGDHNLRKLRDKGYEAAIVAIGSNENRQRLGEAAAGFGYRLVSAISPSAVISPTAKIGMGVAIMAGAVVNADSIVEDFAIINTGAIVDHDCRIGRSAHIAPQCGLAGNVTVGARSFLGIGCKVTPKIEIGDDVTVGAGAVVCGNIPNGELFFGVPAKRHVRRRPGAG
jgi:UDP-perosamine 4-acetyltransferase